MVLCCPAEQAGEFPGSIGFLSYTSSGDYRPEHRHLQYKFTEWYGFFKLLSVHDLPILIIFWDV